MKYTFIPKINPVLKYVVEDVKNVKEAIQEIVFDMEIHDWLAIPKEDDSGVDLYLKGNYMDTLFLEDK